MDRVDFEIKLNTADKNLDIEKLKDFNRKIIKKMQDRGDDIYNYTIPMEELAEFSIEISKKLRNKDLNNIGVIEEMADVITVVMRIKELFGISDDMLAKAINVKLDRGVKYILQED